VDIVRALSEACQGEGLKFGVYLSPWDRNNPAYGQGKAYDDYYIHQLEELLTGYGDIFCVWLDGACGEGKNGKVQVYDWERYYACIRRLQPDACICICGPDIRWCGNEAGDTRPSEWSVVPARTALAECIQEKSQQADDPSFREGRINSWDLDLGSREALGSERELIWYPAEVDTSIRPGFFYHKREDHQQKTVAQLKDIYYRSVGGNATLLLNVPPMPNGRLHQRDCEILEEFGTFLREAFSQNLIDATTKLCGINEEPGHEIQYALTDDDITWFQTPEGQTTTQIQIDFGQPKECTHLVMKEPIWLSQRIERFHVQLFRKDICIAQYDGTIIGYKKILPVKGCGDRIVITIQDARIFAALEFLGVY
jgi:alpha-L-fucosidase